MRRERTTNDTEARSSIVATGVSVSLVYLTGTFLNRRTTELAGTVKNIGTRGRSRTGGERSMGTQWGEHNLGQHV